MPRKTTTPTTPKRARGSRRSTEEVRALIVEAATELFAERGYNQTTMREIASTSGIALSVLYRQFESKERLFSATFVAPFLESFERFRIDRGTDTDVDPGPVESHVVSDFIQDLHVNLAAQRHTIVTMLSALENPGTELIEEVRAGLGDAWQNLHLAGPASDDGSVEQAERARDANMLVVAMVVGLVLFQPWVLTARDGGDEPLVALAGAFSTAGIRATTGP